MVSLCVVSVVSGMIWFRFVFRIVVESVIIFRMNVILISVIVVKLRFVRVIFLVVV